MPSSAPASAPPRSMPCVRTTGPRCCGDGTSSWLSSPTGVPVSSQGEPTVLLLSRSMNCGGAERQLLALAKGLKARGANVEVAVFYGGGFFDEQVRAAGIPL